MYILLFTGQPSIYGELKYDSERESVEASEGFTVETMDNVKKYKYRHLTRLQMSSLLQNNPNNNNNNTLFEHVIT